MNVQLLANTFTFWWSEDLDLIELLFLCFVSVNDLLDGDVVSCLAKLLDGGLCIHDQLIEDSFIDDREFRRVFVLHHLCMLQLNPSFVTVNQDPSFVTLMLQGSYFLNGKVLVDDVILILVKDDDAFFKVI